VTPRWRSLLNARARKPITAAYIGRRTSTHNPTLRTHTRAPLDPSRTRRPTTTLRPERAPGSGLVVGHLTDPEGHLIGVAGPT